MPANKTNHSPIDVVFTWVDPNNQEWKKEKDYWEKKILKINTNGNVNYTSRYSSFDEIRFGLRSVHQYLPWVRHVFIVTNNGSFPRWLNLKHKKVSIVDYRTLLPKHSVPTYNSNSIEAFLYRIPGLSEYFIYFNDDVSVLKPLQPKDFIDLQSKRLTYPLETDLLFNSFQKSKVLAYLVEKHLKIDSNVIKSRYYTMKKLKIPYDGQSSAHCPKILSKTQCRVFNQKFGKQLKKLMKAKFRTPTNLTYLEALFQYSVKKNNLANFTQNYPTRIINILDFSLPNYLQILYTRVSKHHYTFLAIQDVRSKIDEKEEQEFITLLHSIYPSPAPWELLSKSHPG